MSILRYWRYRKARKNTQKSLAPWIELARRQPGGISDLVWQTPYMRGFLPMLITRFAQHDTGNQLDREQLGLIQLEIWMFFSGQFHDGIGEDITVFDGGREADFNRGCQNAIHFFNILHGHTSETDSHVELDSLIDEGLLTEFSDLDMRTDKVDQNAIGNNLATSLWLRYFGDTGA